VRLRVDTAVGIGALLLVQLATSFASVGLLSRTSPAAERVLQESASNAVVEQMLSIVAIDGDRKAFEAALAEARARVTQPEREGPLLDRVTQRVPEMFAGDPQAKTEVVAVLREITAGHRSSMEDHDERARFLGRAGAWTSAFLGGFGFLLSVIVYRRLRERVEEPILLLDQSLVAVREGELRRRVSTHLGPTEIRRIAENVNWLLDKLELARPFTTDEQRSDRAMLVAVLDRWPQAALVLDRDGHTVARNKAAVALWDAPQDPVPLLVAAARKAEPPPPGWTIEPIGGAGAWLCRGS
jgi:hypothetical protein